MRSAAYIAGCWATLFALYLLFAGGTSRAELLGGICTATVAIAAHVNTSRVAHRELRLSAPWGRLAMRLLIALIRDTCRVGQGLAFAVALGKLHGAMSIQPFEPGGFTPQDAARRGIVILAASVTPNSFVIEVREPPQGMLMHHLLPHEPEQYRRWPV